ncbi:hypothetical protein ACNKHQ_02230 [Shigella flexneri]
MVLLALEEVKAGEMRKRRRKRWFGDYPNNAQIAFEAMMNNLAESAKIKLGDIVDQQQ